MDNKIETRLQQTEVLNFQVRKDINGGYASHAWWLEKYGQSVASWDVNLGENLQLGISLDVDNVTNGKTTDTIVFGENGPRGLKVELNYSTTGENGRLSLKRIQTFRDKLVEMRGKLVEAGAPEISIVAMVEKLTAMEQKRLNVDQKPAIPTATSILMDRGSEEEQKLNKKLADLEGGIAERKMMSIGDDWKQHLDEPYRNSEGQIELVDGQELTLRQARRYFYEKLGLGYLVDQAEAEERGEVK